jgi:hypothetical protein
MIYDERQNTYTLSTGRRVYANRGILGITPDAEHLSEGYDGGVTIACEWDEDFVPWTPEERAEVADEMIRRWTAFKDAARPTSLED